MILLGVPTELTVGIALASFVIGVGLTAFLWCIHMRTGRKQLFSKLFHGVFVSVSTLKAHSVYYLNNRSLPTSDDSNESIESKQ